MKTGDLFPSKDFQPFGPCALCGYPAKDGPQDREKHLQYHLKRRELERLPSGEWRLVFGHPPVRV